jgi:hypothetical protein
MFIQGKKNLKKTSFNMYDKHFKTNKTNLQQYGLIGS